VFRLSTVLDFVAVYVDHGQYDDDISHNEAQNEGVKRRRGGGRWGGRGGVEKLLLVLQIEPWFRREGGGGE
jgi:hypothetical protein